MDDDAFLAYVGERLGDLPAVQAVTLGGSRAEGTHRPDSDWDFSIYYRGHFDPQALRNIGWPGEVSAVGGWSKGVFNGGAWLEVDGRRSDVHYRDLDVVEREIAAAQEGRFTIEPLLFHLAGIPSYLALAELSVKRVLRGTLPAPDYPEALRRRAPEVWWGRAAATFGYARSQHAPRGRLTQCAGLVAQAVSQAAHAILSRARTVGHQREDAAHARGIARGRRYYRRSAAGPDCPAGPRRAPRGRGRVPCRVPCRAARGLGRRTEREPRFGLSGRQDEQE